MHVDACGDLPSDVATSVAMDKDRFDAVCGACDAVADALIDDEGKPSLEVFKRVMDKGPISDLYDSLSRIRGEWNKSMEANFITTYNNLTEEEKATGIQSASLTAKPVSRACACVCVCVRNSIRPSILQCELAQ